MEEGESRPIDRSEHKVRINFLLRTSSPNGLCHERSARPARHVLAYQFLAFEYVKVAQLASDVTEVCSLRAAPTARDAAERPDIRLVQPGAARKRLVQV